MYYEWPRVKHDDEDEAQDDEQPSSDRDRFSEVVGDAREAAIHDPHGHRERR